MALRDAFLAALPACALALAAAAAPIDAYAGRSAPDPAPEATIAGFRALELSANLARAGRRMQDPLLLLAAARLRAAAGIDGDAHAAGWIAAAERLGANDPRVASLAADLRAAAAKGRTAGPRVTARLVRAGEALRFSERFRANAPAVVYVEGDGDSDLALQIDGPGGIACRETGPGDVKLCIWTPRAAAPVDVEISNVGTVPSRFMLGTN